MGPGIRLRTGRERPRPGLVGTDREAGARAPRGPPPPPVRAGPPRGGVGNDGGGPPLTRGAPPPVAVTYWFQRNLSGLISPVEPVIHPPRASAKDWPLFVFQQLIPSWVEWQA